MARGDDNPIMSNPNTVNKFPYLKPHQFPGAYVRPLKKHKNMEYRARAGKHHTQLNFGKELEKALYGYGNASHPDIVDPHPDSRSYLARPITATSGAGQYNVPVQPPGQHRPPAPFKSGEPDQGGAAPFPETVRVLDEVVTDFVIEVAHEAVDHATYEGRHKVNLQDVHWVFRNDRLMLGRIKEMFRKANNLKNDRKGLDDSGLKDGKKFTVEALQELGEVVGEEGTGKGKGRGRGKRRKRAETAEREDEGDEGGSGMDGGSEVELEDGASTRPPKRARSEVT
jgi:transcription initiation factor TFIID subunit 13